MQTKNMYFTGDIIRCPGYVNRQTPLSACYIIAGDRDRYRLLLAVSEDRERLIYVKDEFMKDTFDDDTFIGDMHDLFRGYCRRHDIIFICGNTCYYHMTPEADLFCIRRTGKRMHVLKQDNQFMSDSFPFWDSIRIRNGDYILYGEDLAGNDLLIRHMCGLFKLNNILRRKNARHMNCREILVMTGYRNGSFMSMTEVLRR